MAQQAKCWPHKHGDKRSDFQHPREASPAGSEPRRQRRGVPRTRQGARQAESVSSETDRPCPAASGGEKSRLTLTSAGSCWYALSKPGS